MTVEIRRASPSAADLATVVAITNATRPEWSTNVEELAWSDATYPGTVRFIADMEGHPIAVATVGRIWVQAPDYDAYWATVDVVEGSRRRGTGGRLLRTVAEVAAERGKTWLHVPVSDGRPEAVAFLTKRGFAEFQRMQIVRLNLADVSRPEPTLPPGLVMTTLAERPDLVAGVHAVALETFDDIPGGDQPMAAGDLDEFRARDVDRPSMPPDGFMVAIEEETGEVVGYASLIILAGVGQHDMTAVRRAWRGRGIATALKLATIRWAIDHGLSALETGNDEANQPMQAVNRRLGYERQPDELLMRGAAVDAMMSR